MANHETLKADHPYIGMWHIYEMDGWDEDYFNMEVQAYVEVRPKGLGNFQFGLVNGQLDGYLEDHSDNQRFAFTWEGNDEMDPVSGAGWLQLKDENEVAGWIKFHSGDQSGFKARRAR